MMKRRAIVLAAGKGTRMDSPLPKVLVEVCGRPMIDYVLDVLQEAGVDDVLVVVGYRAEEVRQALDNRRGITFVEQTEQLGTGHAVMVCRHLLDGYEGLVLIVTGDSPLMQRQSIAALLERFEEQQPACLLGTAYKPDPDGLGRIIRDAEGNFQGIVEHKDASQQQREIQEVNMSCYVFDAADLLYALDRIEANNVQGEYYVTDCPGVLKSAGKRVQAWPILKPIEALSVNTRDDLLTVEKVLQAQMNEHGQPG